MILQKGITGFNPSNFLTDARVKYFIDQVQSQWNYRVYKTLTPEVNNNYYRLKVVDSLLNRKFDVLLNHHHPFFCGVTEESEWMQLGFIDLPGDIVVCLDDRFQYLNLKELSRKPSQLELNRLSNTERKEVTHWNSETIGEIVFNGYD